MCWTLVFVFVALPAATLQDLRFPYFPWRTTLEEESTLQKQQSVPCVLPPYPSDGGYVVVDEPDAKPRDVFRNVSLVKYQAARRNEDEINIQLLHCSAGEWSRSIIQFEGGELYLNISWCPLLCSSYEYGDAVTENQRPKEVYSSIGENRDFNKSCVLPPYPAGGRYYVDNQPNSKPGDVFRQSIKVYTLEPTRDSHLYKMKIIVCDEGVWHTTILKFNSNTFSFTRSIWCPLLCAPSSTNQPTVAQSEENLNILENSKVSTSVMQKKCVLPQYPANGGYFVVDRPTAAPGEVFDEVSLIKYTSNENVVVEIVYIVCLRGVWTQRIFKNKDVSQPMEFNTLIQTNFTNQAPNQSANTSPELCKLPPYPVNGSYVVTDDVGAGPGAERQSARLEYACAAGHSLSGAARVRCENGTWDGPAPACRPDEIEIAAFKSKDKKKLLGQNKSDTCRLPKQPGHGYYIVSQQNSTDIDGNYTFFLLSYKCFGDFGVENVINITCSQGAWDAEPPTCLVRCFANDTYGITHLCKKTPDSDKFSGICASTSREAMPVCDPPFYVNEILPIRKCVDGKWNYKPECTAECGIQEPASEIKEKEQGSIFQIVKVSNGTDARIRELPWHVAIYDKLDDSYVQICSGSIISNKLIVTAAHCFWNGLHGLKPASRYSIAAGKLYRAWNNTYDNARQQMRDVEKIVIPKRFRGGQTNFQADIAILYVSEPLLFTFDVWPVCVDFDLELEQTHLATGILGKVAGWGLTAEDGDPSPILQVAQLPYVEIDKCINDAAPDFRTYITNDKICAGYTNGTALCRGDSGGGLVFPKAEGKNQRYYLRGIASSAPRNDRLCNTHAVTTFTQILPHEHFIKEHLNLTAV